MRRSGAWWKAAACAAAVAGCFSKSEPGLEPGFEPGGEAGQSAAGSAGDAGNGGSAGKGGNVGNGGNAGTQVSAGSGGASPHAGAAGQTAAGQGPTGGSGGSGGGASAGGAGLAGSGSAGTAGRGGNGGAGGLCSSVAACGGDITGTWTVTSSCLDVRGALDVAGLGLGCASAPLMGSRVVAGTFIANADGTYEDRTTTSGEERIELPEACLTVSGTVVACERVSAVIASVYGYDSVTCAADADGDGCICDAVFEQTSGMGLLSPYPAESGTYVSSGDVVTVHDEFGASADYLYCVSAGELMLLPRTTPTGTPRGSIVLAKQ